MENQNKSEKLKTLVREAKEKATPYLRSARDKAEPYLQEAKEKGAPYLEEAKEKASPYMDGLKKKTEPAASLVRERAGKVTGRARRIGEELREKAQKAATKTDFFLQYRDFEIRIDDIEDKIRQKYVAEGHTAGEIRAMQVYIKPEDHAAYYVINHTDTGKLSF